MSINIASLFNNLDYKTIVLIIVLLCVTIVVMYYTLGNQSNLESFRDPDNLSKNLGNLVEKATRDYAAARCPDGKCKVQIMDLDGIRNVIPSDVSPEERKKLEDKLLERENSNNLTSSEKATIKKIKQERTMNENNNGVDSSICFDTKPEMCVNFKKGDPECSATPIMNVCIKTCGLCPKISSGLKNNTSKKWSNDLGQNVQSEEINTMKNNVNNITNDISNKLNNLGLTSLSQVNDRMNQIKSSISTQNVANQNSPTDLIGQQQELETLKSIKELENEITNKNRQLIQAQYTLSEGLDVEGEDFMRNNQSNSESLPEPANISNSGNNSVFNSSENDPMNVNLGNNSSENEPMNVNSENINSEEINNILTKKSDTYYLRWIFKNLDSKDVDTIMSGQQDDVKSQIINEIVKNKRFELKNANIQDIFFQKGSLVAIVKITSAPTIWWSPNESKRKYGKDFCQSDPRLIKENAEYLSNCKQQHPIYIIIKGKRIMGAPDIVDVGGDPFKINPSNNGNLDAYEEGYAPPLQDEVDNNINPLVNIKPIINDLMNDINDNNKNQANNKLGGFDFSKLKEILNFLLSINTNNDGQSDLIGLITNMMGVKSPGKKPSEWNNSWNEQSHAHGQDNWEDNFDKNMRWNKDWDNANNVQSTNVGNRKPSEIGQRYIKGVGNIFAPKITIDK
jgi:hypothetical protein